MPINNIVVNNYKKLFGGTKENFEKYERDLKEIVKKQLQSLNIRTVEFFNLDEEKQNYCAGIPNDRLVIFHNATVKGCNDVMTLEQPKTINGIENNFTRFLQAKGTNSIQIKSEHDVVLAEWIEETYEINILFNLLGEYEETALNIFTFIMSEFERLVWLPKTYENSWKYTQNKKALTDKFTHVIKRSKESQLREDKRNVERWEVQIDDYRRQIKNLSDNLIQKRKQILVLEENINDVSTSLIKDLDLIIAHEKVEDLQIKDGLFIINTKPLYIYSDKGKRYYGGKYRIELNPENSDVNFFGDNPRKSYWSSNDPHPHVSGSSGHACLGNVSSTIAELCSQMQIYALVMVCIDFLESANTGDVAGKNVVNWDEVDKDGNIIVKKKVPAPKTIRCHECEEDILEEDVTLVYEEVWIDEDENTQYGESRYVCEACMDEYYHFDDEFGEYVRN